ncbi:MAG: DUF4198 domain-containing protein [Bryobacteraceae bacterium]|nr:DUF4198 domain-containing protein [Bryobacteraceae bacterium]
MTFTQKFTLFLAAAALFPLSPLWAHRMWILPSSTVLSGSEAWITVDAAVSNTLFVFEHRPLRLEGLSILGPGGSRPAPQNLHTGQFRSSFDLKLNTPGTYRISLADSSVMASWKENGEVKRWRGSPDQMAAHVPAGAPELQITRMSSRVETYVTLGKPSREALAPAGAGLEIIPVTHPTDLAAGEEAVFALLMEGKPAAGIELTAVQGAGRHVDKPFEQKFSSGPDGRVRLSFPAPGYYWLQAAAGDAAPGRGGSRATCVLVLEVLPQ